MQEAEALAAGPLSAACRGLKGAFLRAVRESQPLHGVEKAIWEQLSRLGRRALTQLFSLLGNGDLGEAVTSPGGRCCQRLEQGRARRYGSVFGGPLLARVAYGSREGQGVELAPLDNRPQLPERIQAPFSNQRVTLRPR